MVSNLNFDVLYRWPASKKEIKLAMLLKPSSTFTIGSFHESTKVKFKLF